MKYLLLFHCKRLSVTLYVQRLSVCLLQSAEGTHAGREMGFDININSVYFLFLANMIDRNNLTPNKIYRGDQHDG